MSALAHASLSLHKLMYDWSKNISVKKNKNDIRPTNEKRAYSLA